MGTTENLGLTFYESGSACLDFFFHIVPVTTDKSRVQELAAAAWAEDPLTTLKLIFQLRGVRGTGKSDKLHFYDAACWLYEHHPRTLAANIAKVAPVGYFKDLLELVQRILEGEEVTEKRIEEKRQHKRRKPPKESVMSSTRGYRRSLFSWTKPSGKNKWARASSKLKIGTKEDRIAASLKRDKLLKQQASELRRRKALELAKRVIERHEKDDEFAAIYSGVARVFAEALAKDMEALRSDKEKARLSLAAKWCPSLDSSYDKQTLLCEAIARLLFPKDSSPELAELEQPHYAYRIRDKLRKEVLVPLRKALELPEVFMSAQRWDELPYNRVASVAMKNYTEIFMKHDEARFKQFLSDVEAGKKKIAAGALLPHDILRDAVEEHRETAELQWRAMVDELRQKGSLQNAVSICDVSGSMYGTPLEVAIALGLLTAELSDEPWKGRLITFSNEPAFHEITGKTLAEKYQFTARMPLDMNTDFQKVFDRILERAREFNVPPEKMVKRLFVYSDMEFDEARGGPANNPSPNWWGGSSPSPPAASEGWLTDYELIKQKFKAAGYDEPPQIVFWNLRDSDSIPVTKDEPGVALVSGFSKNILKMFLNYDGRVNPMIMLHNAISGPMFEDMVVVD
ncbi:uncharacterized protein LOC9656280 [Selaginella moellendorffii]|uniref:uncharacterized protein LOC9656280 n=1 Tax=Selaginella moellendorffii TaxID=88036 RepID=UPI000D1C8DB9|nr:uncharacterized protein LOC9656280 [Selaginella moellendorffii]|eukprot:XP_024541261.1 uncharacterized protein LOC9656280 [Selaginella moellendorffii]